MDSFFDRLHLNYKPRANPQSTISYQNARFTVLTERLLRLEWSPQGQFEDRGSYAFPNRFGKEPEFRVQLPGEAVPSSHDQLIIQTPCLELRYLVSTGPFEPNNLEIELLHSPTPDEPAPIWRPGLIDLHNLRGARRTLDGCIGDAALEEGLNSPSGWALFDDSKTMLFDPDGWVTRRTDSASQDWYFFAYGRDYKTALAEYIQFGGRTPLIPRFALGAWWSRYWAYSAQDLMNLVNEFETHQVPLDVLVVDMDWHTPHAWTGYTWNRDLFPDPAGFLKWVHAKGLHTTLNLHPAQGVQAFEQVYPQFARAMGVDPAGGQAIPFRIQDRRFAQNYFELIHHPMEEEGVDFWWMDWQQGQASEWQGMDPLPWLNHLHFIDSGRSSKRPMLYSRWGGLGNHRYPIGFSGDTIVGWSALQFQPYMTAAGGNVAFSWWSHDIGGHMGGATEPELYTRWVQFGALSPCLRLHATKDPRTERRPWAFPEPAFLASRAAFQLRYRLIPYLYTLARMAYDSGLAPCYPIYFDYPNEDSAYLARYQYFFGSQVIAAPVVFPADPCTGLALVDLWIPPGEWIEFTTLETFQGPRWMRRFASLEDIPMLVKAGAVLPLGTGFAPSAETHLTSGTSQSLIRDHLTLEIFPGHSGSFRIYEDDGESPAYLQGECEWTQVDSLMPDPNTWQVKISPVEGFCSCLPTERAWEVHLNGSSRPESIRINGEPYEHWTYDPVRLLTSLHLPKMDKHRPIHIEAVSTSDLSALGDMHNQTLLQADLRRLLGPLVEKLDATALQNPPIPKNETDRTRYQAALERLGGPFIRVIPYTTPEEAGLTLGRVITGTSEVPFDLQVTFALQRVGTNKPSQDIKTQLENVNQAILEAPFRFEGDLHTMRWEADIQITPHLTENSQIARVWQAIGPLRYRYQSEIHFPTLSAWQVIFYQPQEEELALQQVLNEKGQINPSLLWQSFTALDDDLPSLTQPYGVFLWRRLGLAAESGASPAAYLATKIESQNDHTASLVYLSGGNTVIYINGEQVEGVTVAANSLVGALDIFDWVGPIQMLSLDLRKGENTLLIHTQPKEEQPERWLFGAALMG
ncbi:MAG: DUF5110 domain-containing protein [Anaerolineales bacterium]|nr:DUF5110 domain-containing protein [Anaerolineales bacterium]